MGAPARDPGSKAVSHPGTHRPNLSLAAWSLHRAFYSGELDQRGMVQTAAELGFRGFEMVNSFFPSPQHAYLRELRTLADGNGIRLLLIMCDHEGDLGAVRGQERLQAARSHRRWVDVAYELGCAAIRVNVAGDAGAPDATRERAAEGLRALLDYCDGDVDVLLENHGGLSSDAEWLVSLITLVADPGLGTLPDFGNFPDGVDRYESVTRMMPFARALSAKCYEFRPDGSETTIDYARMIRIVCDAGYKGFVGIEYEGDKLPERDGIYAARVLLERSWPGARSC